MDAAYSLPTGVKMYAETYHCEFSVARKSAFDEGLILSEISIDLRQKVVLTNNAKVGKARETQGETGRDKEPSRKHVGHLS